MALNTTKRDGARFLRRLSLLCLASLLPVTGQQQPAITVVQAQCQLLRLSVPDSMDAVVPPNIQNAIAEFKEALTRQTDTVLAQLPPSVNATSARQHLAAVLPPPATGRLSQKQQRELAEQEQAKQPIPGLFDGELTLTVTQLKPSLLLIRDTFDIACGNDNLLLAYTSAGGAWKRILR